MCLDDWLAKKLFKDLTWICDICWRERKDADISVYERDILKSPLPANTIVMNIKYCNDNEDCRAAAMKIDSIEKFNKAREGRWQYLQERRENEHK